MRVNGIWKTGRIVVECKNHRSCGLATASVGKGGEKEGSPGGWTEGE